MARIYASLVRKGLRAIEKVPSDLQEEVKKILGISEDANNSEG